MVLIEIMVKMLSPQEMIGDSLIFMETLILKEPNAKPIVHTQVMLLEFYSIKKMSIFTRLVVTTKH